MDIIIIVLFVMAGGIPALKKAMNTCVSVMDDASTVVKTISSQVRKEVLAQAQQTPEKKEGE